MKVSKKTNCKNCGVFDGEFCRLGLGRRKPIDHCSDIWRLKDKRCGTCKHFYLNERMIGGYCEFHDDYRNFYNSCKTPGAYIKEEGKDLRLSPVPHNDNNTQSQ